jgi:hypothetical protein
MFNGGILMRSISTGRDDITIKFKEKSMHFGVLVELPSLIKDDLLIYDGGGMMGEPLLHPTKRRKFGNAGGASKGLSGMIGYKNTAGFSIKTGIVLLAFVIF